ncbi:hypothetical protein EJ06DRAFT_415253 [Trichodelitschia bisporula]|uniref:Uncharacterized protein n=1 Tax=Trichodelitschia bisporula TaxID=703511 RepID=A0A6G1HYE7_9PEZI|nr:hypothetical protein EJ06DRAFT_415253 [Trichodelitschia bisporula]
MADPLLPKPTHSFLSPTTAQTQQQQHSFQAPWSPSKAPSLGVDNLPLPKVHRAWERAPQRPMAHQSRVKQVWKRYNLRSRVAPADSTTPGMEGQERANASPQRVVKKLRLDESVRARSATSDQMDDQAPLQAATQWEARDETLNRGSTLSHTCVL